MNLLTTPDVLIIGGGSSGVAAAAGAKRSGASVVLIEKNGFLGGKATAAYVGTVCGLFYRSENPTAKFVNHGFPELFAKELMSRSRTQPVFHKNGLHFLPYRQFDFMMLCDEYAVENSDAVCLNSHVLKVSCDGNSISEVDVMVYNKHVKIYPKAVIDTSGEAILSTFIKSDTLKSDRYQASAHVFLLAGLPEMDSEMLGMSMLRSLKKGISERDLDPGYERLSIVPGSVMNGQALFKMGIPLNIGDNLLDVSHIELFSRKAIDAIIKYLKDSNDNFKNCWLAMTAPETGIRTGPRHKGIAVLDENDVMNCLKSENSIARGAWPIEYWEPGKNPEMGYFNIEDYYDIPAGVLQSNKFNNLFFAGRNLSASDKAIASTRVIGTCLATGYASGRLAAGFVNGKELSSTISSIQQEFFKPGNQ